jgi:spore coat polysaccharide biosynthesis protein SpsF
MKIGFLITARLKSTRLPMKIIKDLNGKNVIDHIIERAKQIKNIDEIILCTSPNPQDKPLTETSNKHDISYFLGDEDDVLKRLNDAADLHNLDYFLGITADNPLFSIYHSNIISNKIKNTSYDFIKISGLPLGAATYGMNVKALKTICKAKNIVGTEIWGSFIDRPGLFDVLTIESKPKYRRPEYRLTLDYTEDYELLNHLYSNISYTNTLPLIKVIKYLDKNPNIAEINKNCIQLSLDDKTKEKIDRNFKNNEEKILRIKKEFYKK